MRRSNQGLTLIELMIVVAIIGIVITIGLPIATEYVKKTHRTEIAALLTEQAQNLERLHSKTNQSSGATDLSPGNDYYNLSATLAEQTFLLTAVRKQEALMVDDKCGYFTLSHTGQRGNINTAEGVSEKDCWGR